jgi:arsenical pump membrane protein
VSEALSDLLPDGTILLTTIVNNLPAVLVLLTLVSSAGPTAVLAVLIRVNIGPSLSYVGSLATLSWRRILADRNQETGVAEFTELRTGLLNVPVPADLWCLRVPLGRCHPAQARSARVP